jgi:hypothetical protein
LPHTVRLLFLLLASVSVTAWCAPATSAGEGSATDDRVSAAPPITRAGCAVPTASSSQYSGRRTSKLRHALDDDDPCANSHGLGKPLRSLTPTSAPLPIEGRVEGR